MPSAHGSTKMPALSSTDAAAKDLQQTIQAVLRMFNSGVSHAESRPRLLSDMRGPPSLADTHAEEPTHSTNLK